MALPHSDLFEEIWLMLNDNDFYVVVLLYCFTFDDACGLMMLRCICSAAVLYFCYLLYVVLFVVLIPTFTGVIYTGAYSF
jgi:hypothetical protein